MFAPAPRIMIIGDVLGMILSVGGSLELLSSGGFEISVASLTPES